MINFITNILAWIVKNINTVIGVVGAIGKVVGGLINIFQPSKDGLVDSIDSWTKKIQGWLFKGSEVLGKFKG